jgi:Ser/Thr protein kinase RdoA (MazF antagonist)
MSEIDTLKTALGQIEKENKELKMLLSGYEKVLQLNEREKENAYEIIKMYENIVEYARKERKSDQETARARELAFELGRDELMGAFEKIKKLEKQNKELKEEFFQLKEYIERECRCGHNDQ